MDFCACEKAVFAKLRLESNQDMFPEKTRWIGSQTKPRLQTTPTHKLSVWVWLLSHASAHGVVMDDEIENGFTDAVEEDESDPVVHEVSLLSAYWPLLCPFLLFF